MKLKKLMIALAALPLVACGGGKGAANNNGTGGTGGTGGDTQPKVVNVVWGNVYSSDTNLTTYSQEGVTFNFAKGEGQSAPVYKQNGLDARLYLNNTMTISSSQTISKIELVINDFDPSKNGTMTANVGSLTGAGSDSYKATWTGSSSSIKFTVTDKQKRMLSVAVTLGGTSTGGGESTGGGSTGGSGNNDTVITAEKVAADYAKIFGFELEEDDYGYWTIVTLGSLSDCSLQEGCEYIVDVSPEYLYILYDVEEDTWDDGDTGYFASLSDEEMNVYISIGSYADSGDCCVQIEIYDWAE